MSSFVKIDFGALPNTTINIIISLKEGENMKKIFAFDLDGTLAELGKAIPDNIIRKLQKIEKAGHIVVICSGKPTYYLCGMMRQVGLNEPVLIGENGATIQFGVDLPPLRRYKANYDTSAEDALRKLRQYIEKEAGFDVWFQPNEVCLTPFYHTPDEEEALEKVFSKHRDLIENHLDCFKHCDSFDLTPKGVNKMSGLSRLSGILSIPAERFIAVGDGKNDYPMFEYAGVSVGIKISEDSIVDVNFDTVDNALSYILEIIL